MTSRIAHAAQIGALALALALVPVAFAAKSGGHHGGGGGTTCTRSTPGVSVQNTWAWSQPGSWGLPGRQLTYVINVTNYDVGCGSSSFAISVSAPSGFSVSTPTNTITLNSSSIGSFVAYVTSPSTAADGNYPLTITVQRAGTSATTGSDTTYYKVYSSDTAAPTLYWATPANGATISGRSYNVGVSSNDDHEVRKIDLYIDNVYKSTALCDDISYSCQLSYQWSLSGAQGQHAATFKSYDWTGNVGEMTVTFTVS
jgi:hypothetical protein